MLTLVFGIYISEAMVNRSLDLGLMKFFTSYIYKLRYYSIDVYYQLTDLITKLPDFLSTNILYLLFTSHGTIAFIILNTGQ